MFDKIKSPIIKGKRIVLRDILLKDKDNYYNLYTDEEENKYWGYDYRENLKNQTPSPTYFYNFQQKLKDLKEEYSFAVTIDDNMIGEVVLHNFKENSVETGVRILKNHQQKGYAFEALLLLISYVKENLKPRFITSKCFKQNTRSYSLLKKCGFLEDYQDDTYIYLKIKNF